MSITATNEKEIEMTLKISTDNRPPRSHNWELTNDDIHISSNRGNGYAKRYGAKRAAINYAEQLGITITKTEEQS